LFFLHHIEHRHADLATDRTAARRREEIALSLQRLGDFPASDHRAKWLTVTHALGHGDDVRHHALLFEAPEKITHAPVTDLHFVSDAYSTLRADFFIHLRQITRR